ncbi:MAG: PEGA domain-containing protein, partial [Elusimicrobiota bacterium]|nr:PEGA domain-containing protein [Elusimicrobiota bacterium]
YDKDGYNKAGYDKDGYNKSGYDKDGYNKSGYDKDGYNKAGYDEDGYNKSGYDKDGYNKLGYDKDGYNKAGYDKDGYNKSGYDKDGYNKAGYDKDGYNKAGYDKDGYNKAGYDKDGYNKSGYDKGGYNKAGFNQAGYDRNGYNLAGYDKDGYNKLGYDKDGYNKAGYDKDGYNKAGYDKDGYNKAGYDKDGYNKFGYDKDGYNKAGYNKDGFNKAGFNKDGYRKGEGKLSGTVEPASSQLFIDGVAVELKGNKYEAALAAGEHAVKVSKDMFDTYNGKVTVKFGETAVLDIKLNQSKLIAKPPNSDPGVIKPLTKPSLALTSSLTQALIGQLVTLTVQTPDPDTEVELVADKGQFEGTDKSIITGRTDAKGKYEAKWASQTPALHKIKLKAGKGNVVGGKELDVEVKYITPEVDAIIKNVKGGLTMGANLTVDVQVRNNGKVRGRYRFELELRGVSNFPLVVLKPVELELSAGQSKPVKFDWRVTALAEYTAKLVVYLVGDLGELQRVSTYEAKLKYTALPKK